MTRSLSIAVEGIELRGRCGVTAEERALGQTLVVDVLLEPVSVPGRRSDELEGTVDYGRVVDLVRHIVEGGEFHLLERLASVILDAVWDAFELAAAEVAVAKLSPPVTAPVAAARVTVGRQR
jgi:dihydroneopterin aldolase